MNKEDLDLLKKLNTKELCDYIYNIYTKELNNIKLDLDYFKKEIKNKRHDTTFKHLTNLLYCKNKKFYIRKYLFKNRSVNLKYNSEYPHYPMLVINGYIQQLEDRIEDIESEIFDLHKCYFLDKTVYKTIHFNNFFKYCLVDCDINSLYYS